MATFAHNGDQQKLIRPELTVASVKALLGRAMPEVKLELSDNPQQIPGAYSASAFFDNASGSGKGLSPQQARASALMECLERYTWLNFAYDQAPGYIYASYNEMKAAGRPLPPVDYFLYNFVKKPITDSYLIDLLDVKMRWLPALSVIDEGQCYYPFNYHNILYSSNGLAAGNNCQEAVVQAICELYEREAVRALYLDGVPGRLIEPSSITSPYARDFLAAAAELGITFDILEIGRQFGVPVIIVRGHDLRRAGTIYEWGFGQGAHVNIELAINRALSEYAEGYSLMLASSERTKLDFNVFKEKFGAVHKGFFNLLAPENFHWEETVASSQITTPVFETVEGQLDWLVNQGKKCGREFYWYDLTNEKLGIPVVRVFSPLMGSVINTAWDHAEELMAAVYYEGGRLNEALRLAVNAMYDNPDMRQILQAPMVGAMLSQILKMMPPEQIFGRDYRDRLRDTVQVKQKGMGVINEKMTQLTAIMEKLAKI